jgi:Helix-turn-helix domain
MGSALLDGFATGRASTMATITAIKTIPHTRIENTIIANMADVGVYAYAVYSAIKMHLNQATGACFPSYATIARMTGIHRSTVIECVKKLTALKMLSPLWRYKEDGSHASNQYNFQGTQKGVFSTQDTQICVSSKQAGTSDQTIQGSRPEPPPLVAEDDHPSRPERPEQVFSPNKKEERTTERILVPTEKQQTCQHPAPAIVYLADDITICHHCYGLLDEGLRLITEETFLADRRADERRALPECEALAEPEAAQPPEAGQESAAISGDLLSAVISTCYILGFRKDNPNVFNMLVQNLPHC